MLRHLVLGSIVCSLLAGALVFFVVPNAAVLALSPTRLPMATPTPDATQIVGDATTAISQAQNTLNVVNVFATILAVVLTFLAVLAGLLAFFGYKSYAEVRSLADELRKSLIAVRAEADHTREALVYLSVGDRLLNQKNIVEALENYRKVGSLLPKDAQMNYVLGRIYSGLGEYDAAIAAFEASHPEETRNQGQVQKELGLAYRRRGEALKQEADDDTAIRCLRKSIVLNPDDADAYAIIGGLYRRKAQYQQALASYERAWRLNPGSSYALGNLASLSWYLGKPQEATMYFRYTEVAASERIKRGMSEQFWDYYDLALAHLVTGNLAEAKRIYADTIKMTPGKVQFEGVLNNLYLLQKAPQPLVGLDEMIKMLEDAHVA